MQMVLEPPDRAQLLYVTANHGMGERPPVQPPTTREPTWQGRDPWQGCVCWRAETSVWGGKNRTACDGMSGKAGD